MGVNTAERVPITMRAWPLAAACHPRAFDIGQSGMQRGDNRVEALLEAFQQLRRQSDLRAQHQRAASPRASTSPQARRYTSVLPLPVTPSSRKAPRAVAGDRLFTRAVGQRSTPAESRTYAATALAGRDTSTIRDSSKPRSSSARAAARQPGKASSSAASSQPSLPQICASNGLLTWRPPQRLRSQCVATVSAEPPAASGRRRPRPIRSARGSAVANTSPMGWW